MKSKLLIPFALLASLTPNLPATPPKAVAQHPDKIIQKDYDWWRKTRFGIFIHWNTSSLLKLGAGSWMRAGNPNPDPASNKTDFNAPFKLTEAMKQKYTSYNVPQEVYDNLFKVFNPTKFDAKAWAKTFKDSGAGYVVFTSKHHDGFAMFDSKVTGYNIMKTPYQRDICKELSDACVDEGLKVIWYYSVVDWYDPRFDTKNPKPYEDYLVAQIDELFKNYQGISGVWWDGGGIKIDSQRVWRTIKKYCDRPIANGRGIQLPGVTFSTPEQELGNFNMNTPWESCVTMQGEGWFWNGGKNIKSLNACIRLLVDAAGGDGNLLLDFGPTAEGTIYDPIKSNYLSMGQWLKKYGKSIKGTRGGPYTPGHWGVSTRNGNTIYLHITQQWPSGELVLPPLPAKITSSQVLTGGNAQITQTNKGVSIKLDKQYHQHPDTIIALSLDKSAMDLAPIHCDLSQSLSMDAKVTSSSHIGQGSMGPAEGVVLYSCEFDKHGKRIHWKQLPKKTLKEKPWLRTKRGHIWRYWMAKPEDKEPWIQLDFKKPISFRRIDLFEKFNRIEKYTIQVKDGDHWKTIKEGSEIALTSIELPQSVTTQSVRLTIQKYHSDDPNQGPGIREFDLFAK